nr:hypothetical protein [uncultured Fluviicola sp.]
MKFIKQGFIIAAGFLMASCEGVVGSSGYVYSSKTNKPLGDVSVELYVDQKKTDAISTKADGYFVADEFVGCVPKCPCAKLVFLKSGFKPKEIPDVEAYQKKHPNNAQGYMTVLLEPLK